MGQSLTRSYHHIIFSTRGRAQMIKPHFRQRLYDYIGGIVKNLDGQLLAAGGTSDHVHLLITLHPKTALADMVRAVKANSSRWIHETFPVHAGFAWQSGYAAFSVSHSDLERVRGYIARQDDHHRTKSFDEEFVAFLQRHELEYDPKYLWS